MAILVYRRRWPATTQRRTNRADLPKRGQFAELHGRGPVQETISSAKAKLSLLDDAMAMPRAAFRERLEKFLQQNGFEI
jgi:hypothetical protein